MVAAWELLDGRLYPAAVALMKVLLEFTSVMRLRHGRHRFLFVPLVKVYNADDQLEHWLKLCNAESVNAVFYRIAFIFEVVFRYQDSLDSHIKYLVFREHAQPLDKIKQVNQQPIVIGHL